MTTSISSPPLQVPRFATPRNPDRDTLGGAVAATARLLGHSPMPWQLDAWDVAGELDEHGRLAYPIVVWIVPRRAGKSLGVLATAIQRMSTAPMYQARYTAQTRQDAARTYRDEWVPLVRRSPLARLLTVRLSNGDEQLRLARLDSTLSLFSPKGEAVHGGNTDLGVIDEAWAHSELTGDAIEGALRPSMKTRPNPQLFIVSAAGTDSSAYLARWRDLGRDGVPGLAYVEWSADPEHDDLEDPALLDRVHPAVGSTIRRDAILSDQATMSLADYRRAYLGVWPAGGLAPSVIPPAAWTAQTLTPAELAALDATRPRPAGLAAAVAVDGARTALCASYKLDDARVLVKVLDSRPGTTWALTEARERARAFRLPVTIDAHGPAGPLASELAAAGVALDVVDTTAATTAAGAFLIDVVAGRVVHADQPILTAAATTAGRRLLDSGAWTWARRSSDTSALEAATLAAACARTPAPRPRVR